MKKNAIYTITLLLIFIIITSLLIFKRNNKDFYVGTFTKIPKEISGAGCSFFLKEDDLKNERYFFVNDFAMYGFLLINDSGQLLTLTSYDPNPEISNFFYKNEKYSLEVILDDFMPTGDESSRVKAKFILESSNSKKIFENIIGECNV